MSSIKKISIIITAIVVFLTGAVAVAEKTTIYDDMVIDLVLQQAKCVDIGFKFSKNENASEDLNNFLKIQEEKIKIYTQKNSYTAVAEILERELIDNLIYFKVNVKADWVYQGSIDGSGYTKNVDVLVDTTNGKIVDIYDLNSFTLEVRGETDIREENNRLTKNMVETASKKYETKIREAKKEVEEAIELEEKQTQKNINTIRSNYSLLDTDAIVQWTRANYNQTYPTSGTTAVHRGDSGGPVWRTDTGANLLHGIVTAKITGTNTMYTTPIYFAQNQGFQPKVN